MKAFLRDPEIMNFFEGVAADPLDPERAVAIDEDFDDAWIVEVSLERRQRLRKVWRVQYTWRRCGGRRNAQGEMSVARSDCATTPVKSMSLLTKT